MRCIITGVWTENKYKNIPVSTNAIKAAKKYQELEPGLTLHKALMKLDKDYTEMLKKNAGLSQQVESLPHKQESDGSSPLPGTTKVV